MIETTQEILQRNIDLGSKAEKAYDLYIKNFIEESKAKLFQAFEDASTTNTDELQALKLMHAGVIALELNVKGDIESKNMAIQNLADESKSAGENKH